MNKYIFTVEGMMCCNCEKHAVDSVKKLYPNAKVTASHKDGVVEVLSKDKIDENLVTAAITDRGYAVKGVAIEKAEKKGLFSFLKR